MSDTIQKENTLNVMVVDDTITYRTIISRLVQELPGVNEPVTASNGKIAMSKLANTPIDLVLLDIEMPEMDGFETLKAIKKDYPNTDVVMISGMNRTSADVTIRSLEYGALDFIPKPDGESLDQNRDELKKRLQMVIRQMGIRKNSRHVSQLLSRNTSTSTIYQSPSRIEQSLTQPPPPAAPKPVVATPLPKKIDVVLIGVSTGGPNALSEVIPKLPGDLGVPILMVQHMPPVFTASLANSLTKKSALIVREGQPGDIVTPNTVYIAPGGKHMAITKNERNQVIIKTNEDPPVNSCRPAVDVLYSSAPAIYGTNILSVILTGMGSDGMRGVRNLKQTGCYSISQSERTCVVYGMPKSVEEAGLSDEVVDLSQIAERITSLVKNRRY